MVPAPLLSPLAIRQDPPGGPGGQGGETPPCINQQLFSCDRPPLLPPSLLSSLPPLISRSGPGGSCEEGLAAAVDDHLAAPDNFSIGQIVEAFHSKPSLSTPQHDIYITPNPAPGKRIAAMWSSAHTGESFTAWANYVEVMPPPISPARLKGAAEEGTRRDLIRIRFSLPWCGVWGVLGWSVGFRGWSLGVGGSGSGLGLGFGVWSSAQTGESFTAWANYVEVPLCLSRFCSHSLSLYICIYIYIYIQIYMYTCKYIYIYRYIHFSLSLALSLAISLCLSHSLLAKI
jgi:hypothetical protein